MLIFVPVSQLPYLCWMSLTPPVLVPGFRFLLLSENLPLHSLNIWMSHLATCAWASFTSSALSETMFAHNSFLIVFSFYLIIFVCFHRECFQLLSTKLLLLFPSSCFDLIHNHHQHKGLLCYVWNFERRKMAQKSLHKWQNKIENGKFNAVA